MDQIFQNLPFEVVAVPQDTNTSHNTNASQNTPIKVKIKMKKGDRNGISRQKVISVPKMRPIYPKLTRRVHSDETIMCFNINMEPQIDSKSRRKSQNNFFYLFKTGKCLGTQDEDEDDPPYMIAPSVKPKDMKSQCILPNAQNEEQNNNIEPAKNILKPHNIIFGKCKPGGCLDPPFGEDKYKYYPSIQSKQELRAKEIENLQKLKSEIPNEDREKNKNYEKPVYTSECNESDPSSTYMLYKADPKNEILSDKYSDSIITYPTRTSSRDLSVLEKNIISKQSSSIRNRQLNIDTYFTPTNKSNSQERKSELKNKKNTDLSNGQNQRMKSNVPPCTIPKSENTCAILLQSSEIVEDIQSNNQERITQTNNKLSHVFEVSRNILRTVHQIQEPIDSCKTKPDDIMIIPEVEGIINTVDDYKNITDIVVSKKEDVLSDDKLNENIILNEINSFAPEISEEFQKLNALSRADTNVSKIYDEKGSSEYSVEDDQVNYTTSNYSKHKNISQVDSKIIVDFVKEEHGKEIGTVIDHSGLDTENRFGTLNIHQENAKKELTTYCLYTNMENNSEMALHPKIEKIPPKADSEILPNIQNNGSIFLSTVKSNEKQNEHLTHDLSNSDVHKGNDDTLRIYDNLNLSPATNLDQLNIPVYSNDSIVDLNNKLALNNNLLPTKTDDEFSYNIENITTDNNMQILKETNSIAKLDISIHQENALKDESASNITPSNISFNANKNKISKEIIPDIVDSTKLNQLNIIDNTDRDVNSTHVQYTMPTTFSEKNITTAKIHVDSNFTENIETNLTNTSDENYITNYQDTVKEEQSLKRDNVLFPLNPSSSADSLKNNDNNTINKDDGTSLENRKDDQKYSAIVDNVNIPTQKTFSVNNISDLDLSSIIMGNDNLTNKTPSITSAKHQNNDNILEIEKYNDSNQYIKTPGKLDVNSIRSPRSAMVSVNEFIDSHLSSNENSTKKDELGEIPYIQYYNEITEIADKHKNEAKENKHNGENITISPYKITKNVIIDLGFQAYENENGETVLTTFNTSQELQRFPQDRIFVKRSVLKLNGSELSFAINSDTRLSLKVNKNANTSDERPFKQEETPIDNTQEVYRNSKIPYNTSDIGMLQESLSAIYDNELIPIEKLIRSLRLEVDRIAQYGQLMRKKPIPPTKKLKPIYSKRCVCTRKWNNYS